MYRKLLQGKVCSLWLSGCVQGSLPQDALLQRLKPSVGDSKVIFKCSVLFRYMLEQKGEIF